jgi:hypothetical protein
MKKIGSNDSDERAAAANSPSVRNIPVGESLQRDYTRSSAFRAAAKSSPKLLLRRRELISKPRSSSQPGDGRPRWLSAYKWLVPTFSASAT